jgi:hypothetical protein
VVVVVVSVVAIVVVVVVMVVVVVVVVVVVMVSVVAVVQMDNISAHRTDGTVHIRSLASEFKGFETYSVENNC